MNSGDALRMRRETPEEQFFPKAATAASAKHADLGERGGRRVVETLRYLSAHGEEPEAAGDPALVDGGTEAEWKTQLEEQETVWKHRLEAARQEALAEGRAQTEGGRLALLRQCAGQWEQTVRDFAQQRDSYFARVEREVVELALAIAARILQREAQTDPLLLSGAVRVALGQLSATTTAELHVPGASYEMWSEMLRLMPNLPVAPAVVADSEMKDGECVLTTEVGRVDLSAQAQLKEIERGFFDLLSHRAPAAGREPSRAGL